MGSPRLPGNFSLQEILCRQQQLGRLPGASMAGINLTGASMAGISTNLTGGITGGIAGLNLSINLSCDHLEPRKSIAGTDHNWVRILLYCIIFLLSVFGNTLIIIVLVINKRLRTVTNSFLLSLAISDIMVALLCMPFTLIPNLMGNFIFGEVICKAAAYFMGISVSVSTFNLVAIAIERYSAICNPLQSRVWQTRSHAYKVIAATWILSVIIMIPYLVYNKLVTFMKDNVEGYQCRLKWPNEQVQQAWYVILLTMLFFIPGVVMIVAYGLISHELYRGIQFEMDLNKEAKANKNGVATSVMSSSGPCDEGDGCYIQVNKRRNTLEMSTLTPKVERARVNNSEAKLMAKRRVIRMLIVIVAMFFICWMPVYVANTWKAFEQRSAFRVLSGAPISFIHLLSYTSACVNPIIYCFMNKRFRKAFLGTFSGCIRPCRRARVREPDDDIGTTGASLSKFSYTTVSSLGPP
ncbi:gastrin/cholecystokinin type B receptor [Gastrophryne carolinensis]